jgi:hypothetical protein
MTPVPSDVQWKVRRVKAKSTQAVREGPAHGFVGYNKFPSVYDNQGGKVTHHSGVKVERFETAFTHHTHTSSHNFQVRTLLVPQID